MVKLYKLVILYFIICLSFIVAFIVSNSGFTYAKDMIKPTNEEIEIVAKMLYGESGSDWITIEEKAACVWVVCNRAETYNQTITEVVTSKNQFSGYKKKNPITDELYEIAEDVLIRWYYNLEGRIIPKEYLYFSGNGYNNTFRDNYKKPYNTWDWSLVSPY